MAVEQVDAVPVDREPLARASSNSRHETSVRRRLRARRVPSMALGNPAPRRMPDAAPSRPPRSTSGCQRCCHRKVASDYRCPRRRCHGDTRPPAEGASEPLPWARRDNALRLRPSGSEHSGHEHLDLLCASPGSRGRMRQTAIAGISFRKVHTSPQFHSNHSRGAFICQVGHRKPRSSRQVCLTNGRPDADFRNSRNRRPAFVEELHQHHNHAMAPGVRSGPIRRHCERPAATPCRRCGRYAMRPGSFRLRMM